MTTTTTTTSSMKANLVFDFPDPSPRFDFNDVAMKSSNPKHHGNSGGSKLKNSKGFGKFKSGKVGHNANGSGNKKKSPTKVTSSLASSSNHSHSPDKSTATTAGSSSLSSSIFDESVFDDAFDDQVFDFGKSKQRNEHNGNGNNVNGNNNNANQVAAAVPMANSSRPSFEMKMPTSDSPSGTLHKSLKLSDSPNNNGNPTPYHLHNRTPSTHSNTGYISEVSEFSFDRVTVNTSANTDNGSVGNSISMASSNVSWNFFEETKDLLAGTTSGASNNINNKKDPVMGFVPYTGTQFANQSKNSNANHKTNGNTINMRDLLSSNTNKNNITNNNTPRIKINMDDISLNDITNNNELPISGIVSSSNQSIVSEMSDVNMQDEEDLNEAVRMHLHGYNVNDNGTTGNSRNASPTKSRKTPPPPSPKRYTDNSTPPSLAYSHDQTFSNDDSPLRNRDFQFNNNNSTYNDDNYNKSHHLMPRESPHDTTNSHHGSHDNNNDNSSTKEKKKNPIESFIGNVCTSLGLCTWYLCGVDTTQQHKGAMDGKKEMTKEQRQKEMDATFIGKDIFCNCNDMPGCGMTTML